MISATLRPETVEYLDALSEYKGQTRSEFLNNLIPRLPAPDAPGETEAELRRLKKAARPNPQEDP